MDDKDKTLEELTQEKDEMAKKLEELDLNLGNELSAKDQEIQAQKTLQQRIENELESAKESAALQK